MRILIVSRVLRTGDASGSRECLDGLDGITPTSPAPEGSQSADHLFTAVLRDAVREATGEEQIELVVRSLGDALDRG